MKSMLFIAFLAISIVACDTPENTSGTIDSDSPTMNADTTTTTTTSPNQMPSDTLDTTPTDTLGRNPTDTLK